MWIIFNKEFLTKEEKLKKLKEVESQVDSQYFKVRIIQAFDPNEYRGSKDTYEVQYQTELNGDWKNVKQFNSSMGELIEVFLYDEPSSFYNRSEWKFFQKLTYNGWVKFEKEEYEKLESFKNRPKLQKKIAFSS